MRKGIRGTVPLVAISPLDGLEGEAVATGSAVDLELLTIVGTS
jgi:hypothetical protein